MVIQFIYDYWPLLVAMLLCFFMSNDHDYCWFLLINDVILL